MKGLGTNAPICPMLFGGGQERNYRPGTENTGMIAGLGKVSISLSLSEGHTVLATSLINFHLSFPYRVVLIHKASIKITVP